MDAISEAIAGVVRRQREITERLARIESALELTPPRPEYAPPGPPVPEPPPAVAETPVPQAPAQPAPARKVFETRIGLTLINRVGAITLVLGIGFFFKWAVDNAWIGPAGRVELGVLAGLLALAAADFVAWRGQRIFAQGVAVAGVAILYLSIYAAFGFYHLIPQGFALACLCVCTVLACALALRYNAIVIAALGLLGGYLAPILLSSGEDHPWFLFTYLLLLSGGLLALARVREWMLLEILGCASTLSIFWLWAEAHPVDSRKVLVTLFAFAFWGLFAGGRLRMLIVCWQVSAALAIGLAWPQSPLAFFALELALAAGGLAVSERRRATGVCGVVFAAFWAAYGLWDRGAPAPGATAEVFLGLSAAFLFFFAWSVWNLVVRRRRAGKPDLVVLGLNGCVYFGACYSILHLQYHGWLGLLAAAVAGAHLAFGAALWKQKSGEFDARPVFLSIGVALAFLTLAIPIQFSKYRITMAWSLEGAALAWIAVRTANRKLQLASLPVLFLVALRLAAVDSRMFSQADLYSTIWNARFLTFFVAAVSCWLSAYWLKEKRIALPHYAAGHIFLLWGLSFEVVGWAQRTVEARNRLSVETVAISIVFALYAVIFVSAGVFTRTAMNRLAGLGLIGLVVLKLYLFDVWQVGRVYRISAFVALGALLLATSFLYSRFRSLIDSLWKDDQTSS